MAEKKDDDIEIEIIKDDDAIGTIEVEADKDKDAKVDEKAVETAATSPQDGVDDLKRQLAEQTTRANAAEGRAREAHTRATTATSQVVDARMKQIDAYETTAKQVLASSTTALANAKMAFKTAMEANDYTAAGEAQASIAEAIQNKKGAEGSLLQIEGFKKNLEAESSAAKVQSRTNDAPAVDAASQSGVDPASPSGRWINQHADKWTSDPVFQRKALLADAQLRKEGIPLDSDEYFRRVEEAVGLREAKQEVKVEERKPARPNTSTAAPASRTVASGGEQRNNPSKVRLTAAQVAAAADSGLTPAQYAKNLLALEAEGKIVRRPN